MEVLLYACAVLFAVTQSVTTKLYGRKKGDTVLFNAIKSTSALLLFAMFSLWNFSFHLPTLLYALIYGVSLTVSMFSGYRALLLGPMALTGMLVSFSVVLPVLFGIFFLDETLTAFRVLGLVALVCAILLVAWGGKRGEKKEISSLWFLFVALTFLTNGFCSILQKQHQRLFPGAYRAEFMLFSMLFPVFAFALWALFRKSFRLWKQTRDKYLGVLSGGANGAAGYATLALAGAENASVLFPAISAGTVLASLLCGFFIFHEKLRLSHAFALLAGVCAVVFLKI